MQSGENMEMLAQRKPNFWIAFGIHLSSPLTCLTQKNDGILL